MSKKRTTSEDDDALQHDPSMHVKVRFEAIDAPGACSIPEILEGDVLLWLLCSDGHAGNTGNPPLFEPVVTCDGELKQNVALIGHSFDAIFLRGI